MTNWLQRIETRIALEILRHNQAAYLFDLASQGPIGHPEDYRLRGFGEEFITSGDTHRTRIGLWHKPPEAPDRPVYVAFHGRSCNWARDYRLKFLEEMAGNGAGVVAVHVRGYGLSRAQPGEDIVIAEYTLQHDMQAVDQFLAEKKIVSPRVMVVGESLGGALAVLMGKSMKKGPATVAGINTFSSMSEAVHHELIAANVGRQKLGFIDWRPGRNATLEDVDGILRDRWQRHFNTAERLATFPHEETHLYLAHAPNDEILEFAHAKRLENAWGKPPPLYTFRELTPEHQNGGTLAHINWDPAVIVADLEKIYRERTQVNGASVNGAHVNGARINGTRINGVNGYARDSDSLRL